MENAKYYANHIEFQERVSPYFHSFIPIFSAWNIENEAAYKEFLEKTINGQLLNDLNDSELFELLKTYQAHAHARTSRMTSRMSVASPKVILLRRH